jgi:hypothetical protein
MHTRDAGFNHSDLTELKKGVKFVNFIRKFLVKFIPLKMSYDGASAAVGQNFRGESVEVNDLSMSVSSMYRTCITL